MRLKTPDSRPSIRRLKTKHFVSLGDFPILKQFQRRFHIAVLLLASTGSILLSCSKDAKTTITPAPGSGFGADPTLTQALPALEQKDMKATALNELMRAQSTSRYLINQPSTTPNSEGCVTYSKEHVPGRYLSANYNCSWSEQARDNPNQRVAWTQSGTSVYAGEKNNATETATLTLTARRIPKANPKSQTKTALATIGYSRSVHVQQDSTGLGVAASSNNAGNSAAGTTPSATPSSQTSADEGEGDLASDDITSVAPGSVTAPPATTPPKPPAPGHWHPAPTAPVQLASATWSTTIEGYWSQPNDKAPMQLSLQKDAVIKFSYLPPNSKSGVTPTVLTLKSLGEIKFSTATACARPIGRFSWTITQADGTSTAVQNITADATGFSEDSNSKDVYIWPTDSCLEFQLQAAPAAAPATATTATTPATTGSGSPGPSTSTAGPPGGD